MTSGPFGVILDSLSTGGRQTSSTVSALLESCTPVA